MWMALAKSLNTVATELSFQVGREKVIELTKRLGIEGVRKTCSMALGDGGISIIEHVGGIATFANDGKLAKPYGILDITTSKGDLLYSRERDEPPAPQVVKPEVAEQMNWMLQKVVTEGTGGAAALDFTNVVGKTGTSTGPKDAWFVGFTGKYVAGVWAGNDDNRAMISGSPTTGGHLAAPIFHNFMAVAHTDMNIPPIPGIEDHPVQVAERARLEELKRAEIAAGNISAATNADGTARPANAMPDQTRDALKKLSLAMRKAGGLGEPAAPPGTPDKPTPALPGAQPPAKPAPQRQGALEPASPGRAPPSPQLSTGAVALKPNATVTPGEAPRRGIP
jgi:penicillin-binding protein 1A